jgi:predicted DNA-binding protein
MKRHNFFLPEPLSARLRHASIATGLPAAELLRRALEQFLDAAEKR